MTAPARSSASSLAETTADTTPRPVSSPQVDAWVRLFEQLASRLESRGQRVAEHVDGVLARTLERETLSELTGSASSARESEPLEQVLSRAQAAIRAGDVEGQTTGSERRRLLRSLGQITPDEAVALCRDDVRDWRTFASSVLAARHGWDVAVSTRWMRALSTVPTAVARDIPLLSGTVIPLDDLCEPDTVRAAQRVGRSLALRTSTWAGDSAGQSPGLAELLDKVCHPRLLRRRWPFTAMCVAAWCEAAGSDPLPVWERLGRDLAAEALLLPRPDDNQSWFAARGVKLPVGADSSPWAQESFLRWSLRNTLGHTPPDELRVRFERVRNRVRRVLLGARGWGDPRGMTALLPAWTRLQAAEPALFDRFLESLTAEDLQVFFASGRVAADRKEFWLQYTASLARTVFYVCPGTRAHFAGGDEAAQALVERLRVVVGASDDALCLVFPTVVVVEFARGDAPAVFVDRPAFEKLAAGEVASLDVWKNAGRTVQHMLGWQALYRQLLLQKYKLEPNGAA